MHENHIERKRRDVRRFARVSRSNERACLPGKELVRHMRFVVPFRLQQQHERRAGTLDGPTSTAAARKNLRAARQSVSAKSDEGGLVQLLWEARTCQVRH